MFAKDLDEKVLNYRRKIREEEDKRLEEIASIADKICDILLDHFDNVPIEELSTEGHKVAVMLDDNSVLKYSDTPINPDSWQEFDFTIDYPLETINKIIEYILSENFEADKDPKANYWTVSYNPPNDN